MDSQGIPCLRIPSGKRERALAIVEYLIIAPVDRASSRLNVVVAAGVLQSLVEAAPLCPIHTYLHRLYDRGGLTGRPGGAGAAPYYTTTIVTEKGEGFGMVKGAPLED